MLCSVFLATYYVGRDVVNNNYEPYWAVECTEVHRYKLAYLFMVKVKCRLNSDYVYGSACKLVLSSNIVSITRI